MSKVLALVASLALFASGAAAEEEVNEYARSGPYIGLGLGLGLDTFGDDPLGLEAGLRSDLTAIGTGIGAPVTTTSTKVGAKAAVGLLGRVGYRILPYFAFEVEGEWLVTEFQDETEDNIDVDIETIVATGNAKVFLLQDRLQPWLTLGFGAMYARGEGSANGRVDPPGAPPVMTVTAARTIYETEFAMRFGGGFDFYATENVTISMGLSYVLPFGALDELDYVSLDLMSVGIRF